MIVSTASISSAVASIFAGLLSDLYGRKPVLMVADILFTIGALLMFWSPNIAVTFVGRFVVGLGIGSAATIVPIYIAECAPNSHRGMLVTANTILITLG